LYCKNLRPDQRYIFDISECDWSDLSAEEKIKKIVEALEDSGLMDEIVELLPGGNYIRRALAVVQFLLGQGDIREVDWFPGMDWSTLLDDLFNVQERYDQLEIKYQELLEAPK
jgi:hypothetical protein